MDFGVDLATEFEEYLPKAPKALDSVKWEGA